jgi:hypothetical protein
MYVILQTKYKWEAAPLIVQGTEDHAGSSSLAALTMQELGFHGVIDRLCSSQLPSVLAWVVAVALLRAPIHRIWSSLYTCSAK